MAKKKAPTHRLVAQNRKARHDYFIDENLEAGLVLEGSEVKSLRAGQASLVDAWAGERDGELWMFNAYIPQYASSHEPGYESRKPRKLLVHKREMSRLLGAVQREGLTLIPLKLYFNERGVAKLELALAKGKKVHDKRQTDKDRSWSRDKARLMREKG